MRVSEFDFHLPDNLIALHPAEPRDSARLLVVKPGKPLADRHIPDLKTLLRPGDVLVVNDTRVLPAELKGVRVRGEVRANVSFKLHKRVDAHTWRAFARPAKKLHVLDRLELGNGGAEPWIARVAGKGDTGEVTLEFDDEAFVGGSPLLMAAVLARFFAMYTTVNSFVRLAVRRGDEVWKQWEPMSGRQPTL